MQGQPLMGQPWAAHSDASAAAGTAGQALLPASSLGPCRSCPKMPAIPIPAALIVMSHPHSPTQGLLFILLQTMDPITFLYMLLQSLIHYLRGVGYVWDEETRQRMEEHAKRQEQKKLLLELQVEQLALTQSRAAQYLPLLAIAAFLVLVLVLWFMGWRSTLRREEFQEENVNANEEEDVGNEVLVRIQENIGRNLMERIEWPVQDLQAGCEWITGLMENYIAYFGEVLSNSFYPVLQPAIGVGSAFEGWSPREQDVVYQVLIPMTPPPGHSFHLEPDSAEHRHMRNFRVRVQLECTCTGEQQGENLLCFLHQPEEELRSSQEPSLLDTLCTDCYLDVHKTARWFCQLVRAVWPALPHSHNWHLTLLPSRRSCQFKVTNGIESFRVEMLFGVRRGDSDIFVSSQTAEAYTPSTTWPETYAVAEVKFFKYIASQAPADSLHLRCLQLFIHVQLGFGFSTYMVKTIVMHLLNIIPVSHWRRRYFLQRLGDINVNLRRCLERKRLNHFVIGNKRLPQEISLPLDIASAEPPNLLHHLAQSPAAHSQAMSEYQDLQHRLESMLLNGH
ncbi:inositol 1,4,5-trisphosphate receptor-interacting protein-like 1 [Prinia subflava]|uniref:inositol 1,4,5-trisphosphate receptor-interacting protein-like 1 n=1 Tax=Prinia subflava TaxID=208062 RepID=UPI002FE28D11